MHARKARRARGFGLSPTGRACRLVRIGNPEMRINRLDPGRTGLRIRVVTVKPGFVRTPTAEKNQFRMPFLVEAEDAARRILHGVERGKEVIRFPLRMVCLAFFYNRLPNWLFDRIFGR